MIQLSELYSVLSQPIRWFVLSLIALLSVWFGGRIISAFFFPLHYIVPKSLFDTLKAIGYITFVASVTYVASSYIKVEINETIGLLLVAGASVIVMSANGAIASAVNGIAIRSRGTLTIGDHIDVCGVSGVILKMDAMAVHIQNFDNELVSIPWSVVNSEIIRNSSHMGTVTIECEIPIPGDFDLLLAIECMQSILHEFQETEYILWNRKIYDVEVKRQKTNGITYPYVTYSSIERGNRLFRAYAVVRQMDQRVVELLRSDLLKSLDLGLIARGIVVGRSAEVLFGSNSETQHVAKIIEGDSSSNG